MIDERQELEKIMRDGFSNETPSLYELIILAKHFREAGLGYKKIKDSLIDFCSDRINDFDFIAYYDYINTASRRAVSNPEFSTISDVVIFKEELKEIEKIKDFKGRLILFSMLTLAKAKGNIEYLAGKEDTQFLLHSGTRIYFSEYKSEYLHWFYKMNLVSVGVYRGKPVDYYYKLHFARDGGMVERIIKANEIELSGQIYKEIVGGELYWCVDCGNEFTKESNRQKRCQGCQYSNQLKLSREYKKKTLGK